MTGPPGSPILRIAALLAGPALVVIGIANAYISMLSDSPERRRGPTIAEPRAHLPEWVRRHDAYVARAMAGAVPLLFLGDSITAAWPGPSLADNRDDGQKRLWDTRFGSRHAENFGSDGEQVEHLLWRLRHGELAGIEPEVIVLLIGTNNIGLDPPARIAAGIAAVFEEIRRRCPRSRILLMGLFPRGEIAGHGQPALSDRPDPRIVEINRLIAPLGDRPRVTYLEIGDLLLGPEGRVRPEIQPDLLHLSPLGYRIWADAIEPTIRSLLGPAPGRLDEAASG